jgi:HAD superfamily hydrolase (TIGR01549 family)
VDSVDLHAEAWQEALEKFGHPVLYERVRQQIGKGGDQLLPVFLTRQEQHSYGKKLEEFRGRLFKRKYLPQVKPFPKVRELFQRLQNDGKQIVLASSAKGDELKDYERIAGIEDIIDHETSSDDAERSKPHPDIFAAALARLHHVKLMEAVVVGDSPYDAQAARKISLTSIGVRSGGFPEKELRTAGFDTIYDDCAALLKYYDEWVLSRRRAA